MGPMERLPAGHGLQASQATLRSLDPANHAYSRQSVLVHHASTQVPCHDGPGTSNPCPPSGATSRDRPPLNAVLETQEEWRRVVAAQSHQLPRFVLKSSAHLYLKARPSPPLLLLHLHQPTSTFTSTTVTTIYLPFVAVVCRATCSKYCSPIAIEHSVHQTAAFPTASRRSRHHNKALDAIIFPTLLPLHSPPCLLCRFLGSTSSTTPLGSRTTTSSRSRLSVWSSLRRVRNLCPTPPAKPCRL